MGKSLGKRRRRERAGFLHVTEVVVVERINNEHKYHLGSPSGFSIPAFIVWAQSLHQTERLVDISQKAEGLWELHAEHV